MSIAIRIPMRVGSTSQILRIFQFVSLSGLVTLSSIPLEATTSTTLSETELFARCYSHLTRIPPAPNHPLLLQIRAGNKLAVDACMELVEAADFGSDGRVKNLATNTDGLAVAQTLYTFHKSWFKSHNFELAIPYTIASGDIYDPAAPALYLSNILHNNLPYEELVTGTQMIEAIRSDGVAAAARFTTTPQGIFARPNQFGSGASDILNPIFPQSGEFLGARAISGAKAAKTVQIVERGGANPSYITFNNYQLRANGGGILADPSFIHLNYGRYPDTRSDGATALPRRLMKTVLGELLCRDVPPLRPADAAPLVQENSSIAYRTMTGCQTCHGSLDAGAATFRQIAVSGTQDGNNIKTFHVAPAFSGAELPALTVRGPGQDNADNNFFKRPADGVLFYRSFDGTLVREAVRGIPELGEKMAEQKDLYTCAARQYVKLFTGATANLQDLDDPTNRQTLSAADVATREFVIQLGQVLQSTQSMKTMLRAIFSSNVYRSTNLDFLRQ